MTQVALVVHPIKVDDPAALRAAVRARCAERGWPEPWVLETSVEDPGTGVTRRAVRDGADLVIAAGGDGTVRAVAEGLCDPGVRDPGGREPGDPGPGGREARLAVVPQGTGNLLGRNLDLPTDLYQALEVAFDGADRRIDAGRLDTGEVFAVMAGIGLDAAMVRDAPEGLKRRVGWAAYLLGILRGLRSGRFRVRVDLDGVTTIERTARAVLVGNVGELQGGVDVLPESHPADGRLRVAVVAARGPVEWAAVLAKALAGKPPAPRDRRLERLAGHRITVRVASRQPREVDGELLDEGTELVAEVLPGALLVRVPVAPADRPDDECVTTEER